MEIHISKQGTNELIPSAEEIAAADAGLLARARAFLSNTACSTLNPGMLMQYYETDGGQPKKIGKEAATTVLYALHNEGVIGPPNPAEVGSRAMIHPSPQPDVPQRVSAE